MSITVSSRDSLPGIEPMFPERWSPRAFDGSPINEEILTRVFEAARWSPSCFNEQPWRFYTSTENTQAQFLSLLVEANQGWAQTAPVIGFLVGQKVFARNGKPNASCELDCGAAWMAMSLQARAEGLYTHGMAGIKYEEAATYLGLNTETQAVLMGFVIGRKGSLEALPEALREGETPSPRVALDEIWLRPQETS
ncbi:MAG: nitroreductase [Bacteroidia bacterium]|jgi:nitroreductase